MTTPERQRVVWRHDQVLVQRDVPGLGDLRDDTTHGRLLGKSYLRAQLGLSLLCLTIALVVTASFPVIAALVPAVSRATVAGLPVTLIVLGFAFYPVLLGIGWFYNRQARQLEARFTELVDPASKSPAMRSPVPRGPVPRGPSRSPASKSPAPNEPAADA